MKRITLSHRQVALVDDADFPALSKWVWRAYHSRDSWYAYRWPDDGSHNTRILMHRQLLNLPGKTKVVFLDGNSLNLQRENLNAGCPPIIDGPTPDSMLIPLTRNKFAMVDSADAEWLARWKWNARRHRARPQDQTVRWYAARSEYIAGKNYTVFMHRQILGLASGDESEVDFWNGNGLDNRRRNLRPCTGTQNNANRNSRAKISGFKGVYFTSGRELKKPYRVTIMRNGLSVYLGHFATAEEGAKAYDLAATRIFGTFAKLNFPTDGASENEKSRDDSEVD
jgi:hypothetical protein